MSTAPEHGTFWNEGASEQTLNALFAQTKAAMLDESGSDALLSAVMQLDLDEVQKLLKDGAAPSPEALKASIECELRAIAGLLVHLCGRCSLQLCCTM